MSATKMLQSEAESDKQYRESITRGMKALADRSTKLEIPGFVRQLKRYQIRPVIHLLQVSHGANFSVPGSGKTTTTLAAYAILKKRGELEKLLVVGPRSAFMPWEEEYKACFGKPPRSLRISGEIERTDLLSAASQNELLLITYPMASNRITELQEILQQYKTMMILDESHYVKRFGGGGTWAPAVVRLAPYAAKRAILTGTPVPHSLEDLWTQMTFLWPHRNLLGAPLAFRQTIQRQGGLDQIKQRIRPFYYRIMKHELNLPKQSFQRIYVPMGQYQRAIYNALAATTLAALPNAPTDRTQLRDWRRNRMIRLLQAASNPTLLNKYSEEFRVPPLSGQGLNVVSIMRRYPQFEIPSKIVKALKITLELLKNGEKVVIWSAFIHNILMLENMLKDTNPLIIYGDVPKDREEAEEDNREKRIKEFKEDTSPRVLIANPSSCAESISLHKVCKNAIYLDRSFNAVHYMQSLDRIHRIGLSPSDKVHYILLLSKNTIDEVIDCRVQDKFRRMLGLLNDELAIMDLDSSVSDLTTDAELDADFQSVHKHLLKTTKENS
jgi:SNF2 family DNA or RNA helicase